MAFRSGAAPLTGALGVALLRLFSWPALEGNVGNIAVLFGFGSSAKKACSSTSFAEGLMAGFNASKLVSNALPEDVRKGNLALKTDPCVIGFLGKRNDRALGRRLNPGHDSSVGIPHSSKIFDNSSTSFFPCNSGSRVSSSPNIQPILHMSTAVPYFSAPRSSSGARYQSVTTSCVSFGGGSPK
jgi:hypothetical protein